MYVLLLVYILNGVEHKVPQETFVKLSYCLEAQYQAAKNIHKQGGNVTLATCYLTK